MGNNGLIIKIIRPLKVTQRCTQWILDLRNGLIQFAHPFTYLKFLSHDAVTSANDRRSLGNLSQHFLLIHWSTCKVANTRSSVTKPAPQYQLRHPHTRPVPTTNSSYTATIARTMPKCMVTVVNITEPNVWVNNRSVNNERNWARNTLQSLTDLVRPPQQGRWMVGITPVAISHTS
jgi:hypothetical protein